MDLLTDNNLICFLLVLVLTFIVIIFYMNLKKKITPENISSRIDEVTNSLVKKIVEQKSLNCIITKILNESPSNFNIDTCAVLKDLDEFFKNRKFYPQDYRHMDCFTVKLLTRLTTSKYDPNLVYKVLCRLMQTYIVHEKSMETIYRVADEFYNAKLSLFPEHLEVEEFIRLVDLH